MVLTNRDGPVSCYICGKEASYYHRFPVFTLDQYGDRERVKDDWYFTCSDCSETHRDAEESKRLLTQMGARLR